MSNLQSSWNPFHFFDTNIRPYVAQKFADAPILLLCGSQARQLNGQNTNLPSDTSDFDFVILYDKLPNKYEAAQFASETLNIPGHPHPVNLDFKIMDVDYLNAHAEYTRDLRRFPFLFNMILDAYPLTDNANKLPTLKQKATAFLAQGPSDMNRVQIQTLRESIQNFEDALDSAGTLQDKKILAYEGVPTLATGYLRSHLLWESSVGARGLQYLQKSKLSGIDADIINAHNECMNGNIAPYKAHCQAIQTQLNHLDAQIPANQHCPPANDYSLVSAAEKEQSNANGMRIMLNQYVGDLRTGQKKGLYRSTEVRGQFIWQLKQAIAMQTGQDVTFGKDSLTAQGPVPFDKNILNDIIAAMQNDDFDYVENLTEIVTAPYGGITYNYVERIYVDDLHRRRAQQQQGTAPQIGLDPWKSLRI